MKPKTKAVKVWINPDIAEDLGVRISNEEAAYMLVPLNEYRRMKRELKVLLNLSAKFTPQWVFDEYEAHLKSKSTKPKRTKGRK